jgi:hypothetical protein
MNRLHKLKEELWSENARFKNQPDDYIFVLNYELTDKITTRFDKLIYLSFRYMRVMTSALAYNEIKEFIE